ncbi:hypothetical protein NKH18_25280 [Streptomyces sp. M10(2022)]
MILGEYSNTNPPEDTSPGRVGTYPMTALTAAVESAGGCSDHPKPVDGTRS